MQKIKRYISYIILYMVSIPLRYFLKIDKNLLLFSARGGAGFEGNSKYLFLYANLHTDYKCVWITKSKKVQSELNAQGYECEYYLSFTALLYAMKANGVFITHSLSDVMPVFYQKDTKVIDLWHGIPIKNVSFLDPNLGFKSRLMDFYKSLSLNFYVSNSEFFNKIYSRSFKLDVNKIVALGYPRIEALRNPELFDINDDAPFEPEFFNIVYAPTFRDYDFENPLLDNDVLTEFDNELTNKGIRLHFKLHPSQLTPDLSGFESIRVINSTVDIYSVLPFCDALISDYSSIIFDYIAAFSDRKIALFTPDLEKYKEKRGFALDFETYFKNVIVLDWQLLLDRLGYLSMEDISMINVNDNSCMKILELIDEK
ncbi:CDP-glycerol glycerophosphotransferase family protein [Vibrio sp. 506]|uniref:CDP-glycerol glycerophosphotransferase family protein n=1 Tax=Vibrio sp. 506 TaxID=3074607 RepID=UPI0029649DD5|nr:CDP-glycerol glycerophosphotransferase family protein [Vibrio sp. 506]MDW2056805.1 CDP-glycerol glycerophosphotransferase family protein [Vibrio sp. 506]